MGRNVICISVQKSIDGTSTGSSNHLGDLNCAVLVSSTDFWGDSNYIFGFSMVASFCTIRYFLSAEGSYGYGDPKM